MLKILTIAAGALAVVIAIVLAYAATRPDHFEVRRSASIKAPAEKIFPLINDMHTFNSWNPFNQDPGIKGTYSGPQSGKGAAYDFEGGRSGAGRVEIADATVPSRVAMRLIMIKPMKADNDVAFTLEPQGDTTRVTWAMDGNTPFIGKVFHLFVNVDRMVGDQFSRGLAELKAKAES
jgi:uncharacterized protein YndB with AHSA1/START domain